MKIVDPIGAVPGNEPYGLVSAIVFAILAQPMKVHIMVRPGLWAIPVVAVAMKAMMTITMRIIP